MWRNRNTVRQAQTRPVDWSKSRAELDVPSSHWTRHIQHLFPCRNRARSLGIYDRVGRNHKELSPTRTKFWRGRITSGSLTHWTITLMTRSLNLAPLTVSSSHMWRRIFPVHSMNFVSLIWESLLNPPMPGLFNISFKNRFDWSFAFS